MFIFDLVTKKLLLNVAKIQTTANFDIHIISRQKYLSLLQNISGFCK